MRMITAAAAAATLVLLPAPAAFADPQAGVAFDATDTTCRVVDPDPVCAHFTAEAVAAYRLGEDGLLLDDVQVTCGAVSPNAVELMRIDCTVNGVALPGNTGTGAAVTGGFFDLPQSYELEVCYFATFYLHRTDWVTDTFCTSFSSPVGM